MTIPDILLWFSGSVLLLFVPLLVIGCAANWLLKAFEKPIDPSHSVPDKCQRCEYGLNGRKLDYCPRCGWLVNRCHVGHIAFLKSEHGGPGEDKLKVASQSDLERVLSLTATKRWALRKSREEYIRETGADEDELISFAPRVIQISPGDECPPGYKEIIRSNHNERD